ncbi:phosphatidate phosphatase APP1 [Agromyces hippuratus]|uniref:Phosphatidate phosphatase APP1 n=1 Tax=Agromyces hippuratus TaxID=286438 RepID=A0A852WXF2_9MICO|nr:phosphatase domain-containing protein [Agromyces hippuratus]NYG19734.1 phosphatidate phosphatase APP1 [Agromyces hippuratus]
MPASSPLPAGQRERQVRHRAARLEDWVHDIRERWARRRGHRPTIVPYTGYGSTEWVRVLCRVLLSKPVDPDETSKRRRRRGEQGIRGWRSFTSVPVGGVPVVIEVGGTSIEVLADRGGVVDTKVPVSLEPGWHRVTLHTDGAEPVEAPIWIVGPEVRFGIISDVDDTVMVTALPRPLVAFWNTFVLDEHARIPTPGMAVLFERLVRSHPASPVIYLSTGAWNVAPTLTRFLSRNLYPAGPLLLTDWGPTHDRWFRSGREHKQENLRRLAEEFPEVRWLLIGDDGQHDEEHYERFALEHPGKVAAVAIRRLSKGEAVLAGGRTKTEQHASGVPWVSANDGSTIADRLADLGVL